MNILVVRHGQPIDEAGTGGKGDPPLSELGLLQADAIAAYLTEHTKEHIDHIVASPMLRAHQTALPLAERLGIEPQLDDRLKEAGHEAGPYRRSEENMDWFVDNLKTDRDFIFRPETKDGFFARIHAAFADVAANNPGANVAVFCHGMVTSALLCKATESNDPMAFRPSYTGLSRVQASSSGEHLTLRSFNQISHLAAIGGATHM